MSEPKVVETQEFTILGVRIRALRLDNGRGLIAMDDAIKITEALQRGNHTRFEFHEAMAPAQAWLDEHRSAHGLIE